jgi:HAD superfamily hydrolase (TIGR01490 family)
MRYLRSHGQVSRWAMLQSLWYAALYKLGFFNYPVVAAKLAQTAADQNEAQTAAVCQHFFDDMLVNYVAELAVRCIEEHRARGHIVTVVSASTSYVVAPVAAHLGVTDFLCTRLEVADGRLTGAIVQPPCYGVDKVWHALQFAQRHGGDLAQAYFYSDSISDLPLLEAVGHPVVVNPDPRLKPLASQRGWPIECFY